MKQRKKGIALFLVLMITGVLTMLVGAFFGANQGGFANGATALRQKEAMLQAETGVSYARWQLEKDATWGGQSGSKPSVIGFKPDFRDTSLTGYEIESVDKGSVAPKLIAKSAQDGSIVFELAIDNGLNSTDVSDKKSSKGISDCAEITCTGYSGNFKTTLVVNLRGEPIYDSAGASNGNLDMRKIDSWSVNTTDPLGRNWIRSNSDIYTPDTLGGTGTMTFDPTNKNSNKLDQGILWSRKDIYSGSTKVDTDNIGQMIKNIRGRVAARSTLNYNLYDLKLEDLKNTTKNKITIDPGRYVYTQIATTPWNEEPVYKFGFKVGTKNVDQPAVAMPALKFYPEGGGAPVIYYSSSDLTAAGDGYSGIHPPTGISTGKTVDLDSSGQFNFDFKDREFNFKGNNQFQVNGSFTTGYEDPVGVPSKKNGWLDIKPPDINLDSGKKGERAFVNVTNDFNITGQLKGGGNLAAGNNIAFTSNVTLTADPDSSMAIWAGHDITLNATTSGILSFQGLVYAKNDVNLFKNTDPLSADKLNNIDIMGSLIARNGNITMQQSKEANFTYSPQNLQALTRGLPNNRRRLSQVSWRIR